MWICSADAISAVAFGAICREAEPGRRHPGDRSAHPILRLETVWANT